MRLLKISIALTSLTAVLGKTVTHNFTASWMDASPDGHSRRVIGINGQWPPPTIEVDKGDQLEVYLKNDLGDRNTSIHFHGMYQNGSNHMDGPVHVTQCSIAPEGTILYNFTVAQNGTYWYHSHAGAQYPDGFRAPIIVHDKQAYFNDQYDEERVITLSDWYHEEMAVISPKFRSMYNPTGAEPVPQNILFNDALNSSINIEANKTYLLRIINIGAFVSQYFWIEDHDLTVVEIDGVYVDPHPTNMLYLTSAQRYSVLLKTKNTTQNNFAIGTHMDKEMLDVHPKDLDYYQTNWLMYDSKAALPALDIKHTRFDNALDDFDLIPHDRRPLYAEPDHQIEVTVTMDNLADGVNYAFFNNITYTDPRVPTLYTVLSAGDLANNAQVYGTFTHPFVLNHLEVVEIVLNNGDTSSHPFHMHGHEFQVIKRTDAFEDDDPHFYDPENEDISLYPEFPMRRDTVNLNANGHLVLRFIADNPGVWLFHCHVEWHLEQGLALTLIEAPMVIQQTVDIPQNHYDVCESVGELYKGNAAGNVDDFLNLKGQNTQAAFLPDGFTLKGYIALFVSAIVAILGMMSVGLYGASDLKHTEAALVKRAGVYEENEDIDDEDIQDPSTSLLH
ncbi:iron transport multicopper oxidase FET3 [Nadsonia fulvescens var. elongata DSM 6958]|uniref:Iron transport multicopper oxidase FET3 n=1 Tax=Nadsonia fulvescens var. elongata DSM 6958 TaxID=857566 RepID=A0A1E3PHQ6_9ASCO|nr:iron transport multicopper oxidase FET3 [Nadsonia fulvescens var. elongata DSM 6958]